MLLHTYADFTAYVDEVGALVFGGAFIPGFPTLTELTLDSQWHTGDPETDPWQWRDRAAQTRRMAFGCILGGTKGFISPALYPAFFAACRPAAPLEERYEDGLVPRMVYRLHQFFSPGMQLSTAQLRAHLLDARREELSKLDGAIITLQREFYITICGSQRKLTATGEPYAWPANAYARTEDWHADWLPQALLPADQARALILARFPAVDAAALHKKLFGKLPR